MSWFDNLLSGDAATLKATGSIVGALANVYGQYETTKYHDKMLGFEEQRVKEERKKDKKRQEAYEAVWAT